MTEKTGPGETAAAVPTAPVAVRRPVQRTEHGTVRVDDYGWLRDTDAPEVRAHLRAERDFYDASTRHLRPLVRALSAEMASRVPETDYSVSWSRVRFSYYMRTPSGSEYAQLCRCLYRAPGGTGPGPAEEVLLDPTALARGSAYVELGVCEVSPDERLLAYSVDVEGDEVYALRFRDLDTGRDLADVLPRTYYSGGWTADSRSFLYTVHDEQYRPYQVWRHRLGTDPGSDVLVLEEPDERFDLQVRACRSGDVLLVTASSRDTTEVWWLDAHRPEDGAKCVQARRRGVEYRCEHARTAEGDRLLAVSNEGAVEFRLLDAPLGKTGEAQASAAGGCRWREIVAEDPAERLVAVDAFAGHLVLTLRREGAPLLRALPLDGRPPHEIRAEVPAGTIRLEHNERFDVREVTVAEESYTEPVAWFVVDLDTGERRLRRRREVPGYRPDGYVSERREFGAPDGARVPVTLVRRRDVALDGHAPCLLYGYGAYEACFEPEFDPALVSLLERGVVFAHAHVRGGGEKGRRWWLEGRLAHKQNTFTDHLSVADALADGLVDGTRLATRGLSAGGLLQGAVFSQRPGRWRAVVAEVPFVDVVTTMLDGSIPLTVNEWDEWGDPRREEEHRWLRAYSPYDNLPPAGGRPALLVTGALHDARVMVWEPAKWVAALRASDPEWAAQCLFRCELGAGAHAGPAGRFARLRYEAEVYAWVLDQLDAAAAASAGDA